MKKRVLSLILACIMLFSLLPVTALAASTPVYLYTLIPGVVQGSGSSADDEWNGMGVGTITGYDISDYRSGDIVSSDPDSLAANISFPDSFPDITVNGTSYTYAETGSENANKKGYYTIEWTRLVVSDGANAGANQVNPVVSARQLTFHLDGQLILNETSYHTVSFALKDVDSNNFVVQSDYSVRVADGYSESNLTVPSFYTKYVNGVEYVFDGWYTDTSCTTEATFNGTITQNTTYYAKYNPTYTVTYTDGEMNGTSFADQATSGLLYGVATPGFRGGTPEDPTGSKIFDGWSPAVAATVTNDATYVAQWKDKTYTVTWLDSDGTQLEVDTVVNGTTATYDNSRNKGTPEQLAAAKSDAEYTYTFAGWAPAITPVNGADQIYRATYTTQTNAYTVTWVDEDGITVLETDENVPYGTVPTYDSAAPSKAADPQYTYTFAGWTPEVRAITGDTTYTATYTPTPQLYSITWMNYGTNNVYELDSGLSYDTSPKDHVPETDPTRTGDSNFEYVFVGWTLRGDIDTNNIYYNTPITGVTIGNSYDYVSIASAPDVTANQIYDAFYVAVERTYTGTVRFTLDNGPARNPSEFIGAFAKLQLKGSNGQWYDLTGNVVGSEYVYQNTALPGNTVVYEVYKDTTSLAHSFEIVNTDNTLTIRHYSVNYDANGGTLAGISTKYYHAGESVTAQAAPTWTGYEFLGWDSDDDGTVDFSAGAPVTNSIQARHDLTAVWQELVDVYVNFVIDHGDNHDEDKNNIDFTLDHRAEGSTGNYTEFANDRLEYAKQEQNHTGTTQTEFGNAAYNVEVKHSDTEKSTTYTAVDATFADVDPDMEYIVTTNKSGYALDKTFDDDGIKVSTRADGSIEIEVHLVYDPNEFDFKFNVKLDAGSVTLDNSIKPDYALVKVTSWYDHPDLDGPTTDWYQITQHDVTYVRVAVDPNGYATTPQPHFPVWNGYTSEGTYYPYYYRIEVVGFEIDGTVIAASDEYAPYGVEHEVYQTASGRAYAEIEVADGDSPAGTTLEGAYYENGSQQGTVTAVIYINTHTVTIDPNGGQWNDSTSDSVILSQLTVVPDLTPYVPTRGNYSFTGYTWYEDNGTVGVFETGIDTPVSALSAGTALSKDYILVANWLPPLTVTGGVEIDTTNTYGDTTYPATVTVELRKYNGTETFFVASQAVKIIESAGKYISESDYLFENLPAAQQYRVFVRIADYDETFRNEAVSSYTAAAYDATDVNGDDIARVDIHLKYKADAEFELFYQVDTTAIGTGFVPSTVKTRPWYYRGPTLAELNNSVTAWENALKDINNWSSLVSDMNTHPAINIDKTDGITDGFYMVEPYRPNGNAYNYAVYLNMVDGVEVLANMDTVPYTVAYIAPAYYVESTGQQDTMLKIILTPKKYDIIYKEADGTLIHTQDDGHTWSFETAINYTPVKSGSVFIGWYGNAECTGEPITTIDASVQSDKVLYAKWEEDVWKDADVTPDTNDKDSVTGGDGIPDYKQILILYTAGDHGSVSPVDEIVTISGEETSTPGGSMASATTGYAFDNWSRTDGEAADAFTFVNVADLNPAMSDGVVVGGTTYSFHATFDADAKGNPEGGGDKIPDKYQLFIEYYSANTAQGTVHEKGGAASQPVRVTVTRTDGSDITVTSADLKEIETVPATNYTFDRWTQEGDGATVNPTDVLTNKTFDGGATIRFYAHFAIDEWSDEKDSVTEGDSIPDYKQALVRFVATTNNRGEVTGTGTAQVFTLPVNTEGKYVGTIHPVVTNVTVTPYTNYAFDYWGDTDNFWNQGYGAAFKNLDSKNDPFVDHVNVTGGQIIVYTAHFSADVWNGGDDIPDHRQILINYVPDNVIHGTVAPSSEVITLNDQTTVTAAGSTASANTGYVFESWSFQQRSAVEFESAAATINPTINGVTGGEVYTFTANFAKDSNNDGIPDKYQATVRYVSSDTAQGTVTVASEIVTVLNNGKPDYVGTAVTSTTGSTAQPSANHIFTGWSNTHSINLDEKKINATLSEVSFAAEAGKEYTFTANFAPTNASLTVTKSTTQTSVAVGETITWTIRVENTGNVKLTGITVDDTISIDGVASTNAKATLSDTNPFDLEPSAHKTITATYQVKPEDAGKKINNTAVATADDDTTDDDTPDTPVTVKQPGLTVTKSTTQTSAAVGETITWTILVENTGNTKLTGITVEDTISIDGVASTAAKASLSDTNPFDLEPGAHKTITATYQVKPEDAGKKINNTAVATADDDTTDNDTPDTPIVIKNPGLNVTKTTSQTSVAAGEIITWTIRVENTGNVKLTGITVDDTISIDGVASATAKATLSDTNPFDLEPGAHKTITATYQVKPEDAGKKINNTAVATADDGITDNDTPVEPVTIKNPGLNVTKTTSQTSVAAGETIIWTIRVENTGNVKLTGITVDDTISIDGVASATAKATLSDTNPFDLEPGAHKTITATYQVKPEDAGKKINNTAVATADDDTTDNDTPDTPVVIQKPGLNVTKSTSQTSVAAGETITWTIRMENTGNTKLTGITVEDTILIDGVASTTAKASLSDTNPFDLEPGAHKTITATYQVKPEDVGKKINNTAVATADDDTTDDDTPDTPVTVKNPGLTVTKTLNGKKATAKVGETITWTVKVENTGNTTLSDITLTDTLYARNKVLTNLALSDSAGNVVTTIAELKAGASIELTASYKVTFADEGKVLKNVAIATTPGDGPTDQGESETIEIPDPYIPPVVDPDPPKLNKEDHFAYIIGKDDGLVHPLDPITRAETATIFFRMLLEESRQAYWTQENNYVDVAITDWFNNAASTLSNAGIITGRPGGYFAPYANITRAEFATLAIRFFLNEDVEITENNLTDVKGHWAEANINLAYALGLITGYPDDTFRPDQEITRAEAMVIVNRVLERHPDKDHLLNDMITWPDNMDPNVWYYADVQEATNSHLYVMLTGNKGEKYEVWQQLLPVRDWAALEKAWSDANSSYNPGEVVDVKTGK